MPEPAQHFAAEIATQPDDWARVVGRLAEPAASSPVRAQRSPSSAAARPASWPRRMPRCREAAGQGEHRRATRPASTAAGRGYDRVVAITRSGTTTEVIDAARPRCAAAAADHRHRRHGRHAGPELADARVLLARGRREVASCRPGSPRRRSRCCGPRLGEDLTGGRSPTRAPCWPRPRTTAWPA